jgi:hypothetical protein
MGKNLISAISERVFRLREWLSREDSIQKISFKFGAILIENEKDKPSSPIKFPIYVQSYLKKIYEFKKTSINFKKSSNVNKKKTSKCNHHHINRHFFSINAIAAVAFKLVSVLMAVIPIFLALLVNKVAH